MNSSTVVLFLNYITKRTRLGSFENITSEFRTVQQTKSNHSSIFPKNSIPRGISHVLKPLFQRDTAINNFFSKNR